MEQYYWTLWFIIPLSLPVLGLLFQAACALSNKEFAFLPSVLIGSATFYASFFLGWWVVLQTGGEVTGPANRFGLDHILGIGLAALVSWVLGSVVYTVVFKGRAHKGVQVAGLEVLLRLLLGALLGGIVLVVLATVQVWRDPETRPFLIWGGVILAGILAVVVAIAILLGMQRRPSR